MGIARCMGCQLQLYAHMRHCPWGELHEIQGEGLAGAIVDSPYCRHTAMRLTIGKLLLRA